MINSAWEWAKARNLIRTNPIHQEQEAKLLINESFELCTETGSQVDLSGTIEAQDESGFLLESDIPASSAAPEDVLREAATASSAGAEAGVDVGKNTSPAAMLANFLEIMGRKIDSLEDHLEVLMQSDHNRAKGLHEQMSVILTQMQEYYKCLTQKQTQAITTVPDKLLDLAFNDDLLRLYAEVTKQDVILSVLDDAAAAASSRAELSSAASDEDSSMADDLANELFVGFEAESARRVVRLARVANTKLRKHGIVDHTLSLMARCAGSKGNECEHSFTTRLLYTLVPSQVYYKKYTLDMLHAGMVEDLLALYNDGFKVPFLEIYRVSILPMYTIINY
ncbi:unnamed protein product [Symbiodinium sp. CCMP2592]|nr:unnamed protein product [Symbiodinium sp. CCMP2592]